MPIFDDSDQEILNARMAKRILEKQPLVGDFVRFPSGELERFSHDHGDALQTSPHGSFYLHDSGHAGFSGGLNPAIPADTLKLTEESRMGEFWFFHHGQAGAHRGGLLPGAVQGL